MPSKAKNRQTRTRKGVAKRRNIDPVSLYYGLQSAQTAKQMGLDKQIDRAFGTPRKKGRNPVDENGIEMSLGHIEFTPDGIERYIRDGYIYQAFVSTPVFDDGYRMGSVEGTAQEFARENPAKYLRCVKDVQARGGANGYAVCAPLKNPRRGRCNPQDTADAAYEMFHGAPPTETIRVSEQLHVHGDLAGIGDLCHIVVKLTSGAKSGDKVQLNAPDPAKAADDKIVRVAMNEDRTTVYFVGGDQSLDLPALGFRESFDVVHDGERFEATDIKDNMIIGLIQRIMYRTEKAFDDFETIDYHHMHGEDTSKYPTLTYDSINEKMGVFGGEYGIDPKGIVN